MNVHRKSTGLLSQLEEKVRQHLITVAEQRAVTTYPAMRKVIGNKYFMGWKEFLAPIDNHEVLYGRPPLSPLVVSSQDMKPKSGCRDSARRRKDPLAKDPEFEAKSRNRAWDFWQKVTELGILKWIAEKAA